MPRGKNIKFKTPHRNLEGLLPFGSAGPGPRPCPAVPPQGQEREPEAPHPGPASRPRIPAPPAAPLPTWGARGVRGGCGSRRRCPWQGLGCGDRGWSLGMAGCQKGTGSTWTGQQNHHGLQAGQAGVQGFTLGMKRRGGEEKKEKANREVQGLWTGFSPHHQASKPGGMEL